MDRTGNSQPFLSLITVNFNNGTELENTILSVINQSFTDFEFLIIDGGSADKSVDVIKSYSEKIDYWVSERDNGIFDAMNKGILVSKGEYCLFLNSGDTFYYRNTLKEAVGQFDNKDIVYGNALKVKPHYRRLITYKAELTLYDFYKTEPCLHHQATFIKRKLFSEYGMYDEQLKINADWEFFFRVIMLNKVSTKYIRQTICFFDGTGVSNTLPAGSSKRVEANEGKLVILQRNCPQAELDEYKKREEKEAKKPFLRKMRNKISNFSLRK